MNKNKIYKNLDVNLNKIESIVLKQYNQDSQWLVIKITENGKPFSLEESDTCIFKMKTPDNREICNDSFFENDIVIVEFTKNCCSMYGTGIAELNILNKDTNSQIATFNFNVVIEKSVFDNSNIEGSSEFSSLADRIMEADKAIEKTNSVIKDLQDKLDSHHFILTEDKDIANGVPSLDENAKVPIEELYESSITNKGIVQLSDSVNSNFITTAATSNSIKTVYDSLIEEVDRASSSEENLELKKANIANPEFTGIPKAPTASVGNNTTQIATTAFVQTAVGNGIAASDAMIIKGTIGIDESGNTGTVTELPTTYKTGWTYRVVYNGTYAGEVCEIGDLIIALVDRDGTENKDSDWCIAQTNINGAITGIRNGDDYLSYSQSGSIVTIAHNDVTRTNTFSDFSPFYGENFTAVKSIKSDTKGHITQVDTETITLPDVYTHPNTPGNKHIPNGGSNGQVLTWKSDGEAEWDNVPLPQGDTTNNIVTFTNKDNLSPTAWTDVEKLASGEKHSSIFNKISTMFKNIRYLYKMLGTTDISNLSDGTITGAINKLNTDITVRISDKVTLHCVGKYVEIDLYDYTISDNITIPAEYIPLGRPVVEIAVIHAGPDRLTTGRMLINGINLVFYGSDWTNITHEQGYYVRGSISYIRASGI